MRFLKNGKTFYYVMDDKQTKSYVVRVCTAKGNESITRGNSALVLYPEGDVEQSTREEFVRAYADVSLAIDDSIHAMRHNYKETKIHDRTPKKERFTVDDVLSLGFVEVFEDGLRRFIDTREGSQLNIYFNHGEGFVYAHPLVRTRADLEKLLGKEKS